MEMTVDIGQLVLGIGTILISVYLLLEQFRDRRVSNYELMIKSFNEINQLGLASKENTAALLAVLYPDLVDDEAKLRQRLFIYHILNALELTFLSKKYRGVDREMADKILADFLEVLLKNTQTIEILEAGTYSKDFKDFALRPKRA